MNYKTKKTKRMRLLALLLAASLILNLACITDYAKASGRKHIREMTTGSN